MNLGENIKTTRKALGMTQGQLAESLGVYQKDVCRWEKGTVVPSVQTLVDICKVLNVSADELLELN